MDTQRLILLSSFRSPHYSCGRRGSASTGRRHRRSRRLRAPLVRADRRCPQPRRYPGLPSTGEPNAAPAAAPAGETITIRTDLYSARHRYRRRGHHQGRVERAPRHRRQVPAVSTCCRKMPTGPFVAQSGLLGEGLPNHRTLWQPAAGPRELAPGADTLELKLQASAANGDKVVQTLTFHRGSYVIDVALCDPPMRSAAPITPLRLFPVHPRYQVAEPAELDGALVVHPDRSIYNEADKFKKSRIRRPGQARQRSEPQAAVHQERRQRLGGDGRALLRRRVASFRGAEDAARVLCAQARQRSVRRRSDRPGAHDRTRRDRRHRGQALRRAAGSRTR